MLEVFINTILYIRKAYPAAIFEKRKLYSTFVYVSVYPPLNTYISDVLNSAVCLLKVNKLRKVEVLFSTEDSTETLERFTFETTDTMSIVAPTDDEYKQLSDFEEKLRSVLLTLDTKCKNLKKLPDRFSFKINLHTTQSGFVKLTDKLPVRICKESTYTKSVIKILPFRIFHGSNKMTQCQNLIWFCHC